MFKRMVYIFDSEIIKLKKNYSLILFFLFFLIGYAIFSFVAHLQRWGDTGNLSIPLNRTYGGYIFYKGFWASLFILVLILATDVKDEIRSGKINFILTQTINRNDYIIGKVAFWSFIAFFWTAACFVLSILVASNVFPKTPLLISNDFVSNDFIIINYAVHYILLLPLVVLSITGGIFLGIFIQLPALSITFSSVVAIIMLVSKLDGMIASFASMKIFDGIQIQPHLLGTTHMIQFLVFIAASCSAICILLKLFSKKDL